MNLYYDIEDAKEAITRIANKPETVYVSGKGNGHFGSSTLNPSFGGATSNSFYLGLGCSLSSRDTTSIDATVKEYAKYRVQGSCNSFDYNRSQIGFTLGNFVPTVWELIPYSFVIDYFANIGTVLKAMTLPTPTMIFHNRSTKVIATVERKIEKVSGPLVSAYQPGSVTRTTVDFKREILSGNQIDVPPVDFSIPNVSEWLNVLALASSARRLSKSLVSL